MRDDVPHRVALVTGADMRRGAPGGTRSYVAGLTKFLAAEGVEVDVWTNGPFDNPPSGSRVISITPSYVPSSFAYQRALRRWARRNHGDGVDLLHFQRPDDLWPFLGDRVAPSVLTLHGDGLRAIRRRRGWGMALVYRLLESRTIHRYAVILAVDEGTAKVYSDRYPRIRDRLFHVPIAVDRLSLPEDSGVPSQSPGTFLYAGRLSAEKRVDAVIRAMGDPAISGAQLLIAGSGPEESRLRALAAGLNVTFLGNVGREELDELYGQSAALVLASEFEGLPTVILEALAHRCPIVAVQGSGVEPLIGSGSGIVVQDVEHLPSGMLEAAGLQASRPAITLPEKFTWSVVGPQILDAYRAALRGEAP